MFPLCRVRTRDHVLVLLFFSVGEFGFSGNARWCVGDFSGQCDVGRIKQTLNIEPWCWEFVHRGLKLTRRPGCPMFWLAYLRIRHIVSMSFFRGTGRRL
jgi:hypothetical protein